MRPQLQLTNEGKTALIGVTAVSLTHFLCGSSFDTNNEEIQDESPFQFNIAFQKTYIKGQQYQKDGVTVTEGYNHVKVIGYLSASDITFDETGEYTVREIALIGTINNESVVIAYGWDEEGIKLYENSEERQVIKLDIICEDTPNIVVNNSTGYVNYGDFLDHRNGILTSNNPVHGLTYQNGRLCINGSPLTIDVEGVSNAVFDNVIGVNSEIEVLPSASDYTLGHIIRDKATGLMYQCVDNGGTNAWQTLQAVNPRFETIEGRLSAIQWFPTREDDTAYVVGDVVKHSSCTPFQYLECVVAGTSDSSNPTLASTGQLMTDGTAKWLVLDMRDSAPVGTIRQDIIKRDGWLKLNGATINVADYPRLVNFLVDNSLLNAYTATPDSTKFYYGDSNNTTLLLPDFEGLFIENSVNNTLSKVNAGLPNITGSTVLSLLHTGSFGHNQVKVESANGAFSSDANWEAYQVNGAAISTSTSTDTSPKRLIFDASLSNSIYGNSNTVQPPAVKLIPVIKY